MAYLKKVKLTINQAKFSPDSFLDLLDGGSLVDSERLPREQRLSMCFFDVVNDRIRSFSDADVVKGER